MAQGPGQLTVPGGAMVFLFEEENRDGMATVIFDGQVRKDMLQSKTVFLNNFVLCPPWIEFFFMLSCSLFSNIRWTELKAESTPQHFF